MECVVSFTIDDLFTMDIIWWWWEKNPEIYKNGYENQGKIACLIALPSPSQRYGGRLFSGVRKHQKQAGPILCRREILA